MEKNIKKSCGLNKTSCVGYKDGYCVSIENCLGKETIEEMRKDVANIHRFFLEDDDYGVLDDYITDKLFANGYRKIPEGAVVLSKEEYEKMKSLYECSQGAYMTSKIGDLPLTIEGLRKAVDEITRLYGVQTELQELNAKYYNEAKDLRREKTQVRKETAREILQKLKEIKTQDCGYTDWLDDTYFGDEYKKLAKQFGVEIEG